MSFCRITGKARGLPKPNYFPLLPPISPADAKRCCRITTKSQGLPGHHFIPAILKAKGSKQANCRVTSKSEGQGPHHYPSIEGAVKPHDVLAEYKYVFPTFDDDKKQQKALLDLLSTKLPPGENNAKYVYAIEENMTGLVIPAELEAAVRDGDVKDVMLDKEGDTMLVKMHRGPNVTVDVTNITVTEAMILWEGLGPSEEVLLQRAKEESEAEKRKKSRENTMSKKSIFEEKERRAEKEEQTLTRKEGPNMKKSKAVKVKIRGETKNSVAEDIGQTDLESALSEKLTKVNNDKEPIFGHVLQTPTGVEFFPDGQLALQSQYEGKVIPGQLTQHSGGVKFVPGIMSEGRFVPGQVVVTDIDEHFVPGQVVETSDGPKFVPGQIAQTSSGPKFVPGQTIETENGPQFVPGQIIETKVGPTFIPGQIITMDDEARFIPGRVVDTSEGPRFVPGRVLESSSHVAFVSGQIVETFEGLKFVAPDLEYVEGGHEFSVQGFEVTPEELKLLRPAAVCNHPTSGGDMTINSKMLRQLSEAGISVGRHVPTELPTVDIRPSSELFDRLKLEDVNVLKMERVITCLAQAVLKIAVRKDVCASHINVDDDVQEILRVVRQNEDPDKYLKSVVASAVLSVRDQENITEESAMNAITAALELTLGEASEVTAANDIVQSLSKFLTKAENFERLTAETEKFLESSETAVDRIKFALGGDAEPVQAVTKIVEVLNHNTMGEAFQRLSSADHDLLKSVIGKINNLEEVTTDTEATEILQKAIVGAVRERGEERLRSIMKNSSDIVEQKDLKELFLQSIGLARALGMTHVAAVLLDVLSDSKSLEVLSSDPTTVDILERLTIMRQFAELKPELNSALKQLVCDPELAKSDPGVRELVRASTALMVIPEEPLQSSREVPISLLMPYNSLAMEEFLAKTRRPQTLLIIKSGLQAVVPREAARAVLTGQVPYAVLDEKGLRYFEPLHVFSTMKLPQFAAHCFSMYRCPEIDPYDSETVTPSNSTPRGSISSTEENSIKKKRDGSLRQWSTSRNGQFADKRTDEASDPRRSTIIGNQPLSENTLDRRPDDWTNGTVYFSNTRFVDDESFVPENSSEEKEMHSKYVSSNASENAVSTCHVLGETR